MYRQNGMTFPADNWILTTIMCSLLLLLLLLLFPSVVALQDGLALRPPMGWRSWNLYGIDVDQNLIIKIMEGMVQKREKRGKQQVSLCDLG
jgi:hypothetical protein